MASDTTHQESIEFAGFRREPIAVIAVAYSPESRGDGTRFRVESPFTIGRRDDCSLPLFDQRASKLHCGIFKESDRYLIKDLGSSNGTFVDGVRVSQVVLESDQHVVRVGRTVLIFHPDAGWMLGPSPSETFGIAGPFYTGALLSDLREAALERRHVLLCGPSGSGKERAAVALASLLGAGDEPLPILAHNCARFTSEEEATSTLFGVGSKVFSNVEARSGLVERASGGVLFLDEVHNLPDRVQRSLLRVIEDGQTTRIGESAPREAQVRFVFASNAEGTTHGLAHDLFARLRLVRIRPLSKRRADIPALFNHLLEQEMAERGGDPAEVLEALGVEHYELLCNNDFASGNVRELKDLVLRIVSKKMVGKPSDQAVNEVFAEETGRVLKPLRRQLLSEQSPSQAPQASPSKPLSDPEPATAKGEGASRYELHRETIINTYRACEKNTSATRRELEKLGIETSYRWLSTYLKKWGEL